MSTTTIYTLMQRDTQGDTWICVGSRDTERAIKLLRTELRGDTNTEYQIIPLVYEPK